MTAETASRQRGRPGGSIRLRYTAIATALAALALCGGGTIALLLYRAGLISTVDQAARTAAQQVAIAARGGTLPSPIPMPVAAGVPRIQVLDGSGRIVSGDPASVTIAPLGDLARQPPGRVTQVDHPAGLPMHRAAVVTVRVQSPKGPLVVVAAASLDGAEGKAGHALALGGVLAAISLLLVAVVAWLTTGRTLRRVEGLRAEVAAITVSGDLARRVPDTGSDELGRLGYTLNEMLAAIARSSERQRRFVADAAHELRTPISGVTAALDVAVRHPATISPEWLDELTASQRRLTRLVNDLLELASLEAGPSPPRHAIDLAGLVTDSCRRALPPGFSLGLDRVQATHVDGVRTQVERIVTNLVDNALRHARSQVEVSVGVHAGQAVLAVADDGPGIAPEQQTSVWQPFVRLDDDRSRPSGGAGLGLALVRELAEAHHGTVDVGRSSELGGAAFVVRLPLLLAVQPPVRPAALTDRGPRERDLTRTGAIPRSVNYWRPRRREADHRRGGCSGLADPFDIDIAHEDPPSPQAPCWPVARRRDRQPPPDGG